MARWLEILSEIHYTIEHLPGRLSGNVDGLSRKVDTCLNIERRDGGATITEVCSLLSTQADKANW